MEAVRGWKNIGKYSEGGITFLDTQKKSAALQSTRLCYTIVNSFTSHLRESGLLFDFEEPWTTAEEEEF